MRIKFIVVLALAVSVQTGCDGSASEHGNPAPDSGTPPDAYPTTKRGDVVETHLGISVTVDGITMTAQSIRRENR